LHTDNGKEFIATVVVDLLKESNPNCLIVTGRPRTLRDQGSVESANKIVQQVLKSISSENHVRSIDVNWTNLLGQVMAVCNSHSGRQKHSVSSYEAVFGQKYHPQLKCKMSEIRECRSIFQRLKMSSDEQLETYVRQHDIVDIKFNSAECIDDDDIDGSDEDEGVDIDDNAFPELKSEENNVHLSDMDRDDGVGDTTMHGKDEDDNNMNKVLVVNPPAFVVDPPPVYCQLTLDSPPLMDNEPMEPTTFHVREYSTFTVQEAWDHGNITWYHKPVVGSRNEYQFLWPTLTCTHCCFLHGVPYIQIGNNDYISSMTNTTNWYDGVFVSSFAQMAAHYAHITYEECNSCQSQ
jgi:hypothetical protein